ncbi:MAG: hypothetical protein ACI4IV_01790 [Acutalibacteraceae bacterium]
MSTRDYNARDRFAKISAKNVDFGALGARDRETMRYLYSILESGNINTMALHLERRSAGCLSVVYAPYYPIIRLKTGGKEVGVQLFMTPRMRQKYHGDERFSAPGKRANYWRILLDQPSDVLRSSALISECCKAMLNEVL